MVIIIDDNEKSQKLPKNMERMFLSFVVKIMHILELLMMF